MRLLTAVATLLAITASHSAIAREGAIDPNNPPHGRFSDDWAELYLLGTKTGYAHSTMAREGDLIHTSVRMEMRIARGAAEMKIIIEESTTERLDGTPVGFEQMTEMAAFKTSMKGTITDGKVTVVSSQLGMTQTHVYEIPPEAYMTWGSYRESLLKGLEPGTEYTLQVYSPGMRLDGLVPATTRIGEIETVKCAGSTITGRRVSVTLEMPAAALEMISWVDPDGEPLLAKLPLPGMGDLEVVTVDQAAALSDYIPPELFMKNVVEVKQKIDVRSSSRIKYRVRPSRPDVELGILPSAASQKVTSTTEKAIEVVVSRQLHKSRPSDKPSEPPSNLSEYLDANLIINTGDPELIKLAKKAGGGESDPFTLGDKLRRFVTDYVRNKNLNIGFATASEVCRTREGDCSEHGVLLAALGRLNGLPSRVAVGLAYVPVLGGKSDVFGYHMWTQFLINGRWYDFDAALDETECSPTRIAFATSSLRNTGLADLSLPLLSKIGGISIDIIEVETTPTGQP